MENNPGMIVEIQSHTDSRGPANYNLLLSHKRANGVVDYLVSKGISRDRLKAVGKGEKELTNKCSDGVPCSNPEHAKNRRTEFIILSNE
jgi:outer membrane protein OmpA-like peptidoglycan-associated protein